jgi:hypothetical protein
MKTLRPRPGSTRLLVAFVLVLVCALLFACAVVVAGTGQRAAEPVASGRRHLLPDLIRKEPYLIWPGDVSRMQVLWQLTSTGQSTIAWGADTTYTLGWAQTSEYDSDHQHTFTIPNLIPGRKYYYRVAAQGPPYKGSFVAAPPADQADLNFTAYGDTRSYPAVHDQVAGAIIATYTADPSYQTLAIVVGDLVDNGDSEIDWTNEFFSPAYRNIRTLTATLPYQACMGNHEGSGALFVKYFPDPFVGGRYWSFDYGPAHFTMIDQYSSYGPGSAQLRWIDSDLAASTKKWKFIVLHEPGWSASGGHENNPQVQTEIQPLCLQHGVSIVFGGHNHFYARTEVNGIEHLTLGGGGAPLYTPAPNSPYLVASAKAYHYCRIAIKGEELTCQVLTPEGVSLDSFVLHTP